MFDLTVVMGDQSELDNSFIKYVIDNRVDLILSINFGQVNLESCFGPNELRGYSEIVLSNYKQIPKSVDLRRRKVEFKLNVKLVFLVISRKI